MAEATCSGRTEGKTVRACYIFLADLAKLA